MIEYPEGATPLDPDELQGLKFPHVTTRGELDHLEQANIQNGLRWGSFWHSPDQNNDTIAGWIHRLLQYHDWPKFLQHHENSG